MNRESLNKLHLDRRLLRRKGWISSKELDSALKELPDAGAKATTLGAIEDQKEAAAEAPSGSDA